MINLNFSENELETLKEYFQNELNKAEQKVEDIRGILQKIGKKPSKELKSEKKKETRGREKTTLAEKVKAVITAEKKKPGRKPKALLSAETIAKPGVARKRGRPAKVKTDSLVIEKKGKNSLAEKPKAVKASLKAKGLKDSKIKTNKGKVAVVADGVKRKRGRPKANPEVVAEKKTKVVSKSEKSASKSLVLQAKTVKSDQKTSKKKEVKVPKIPWGDWILTILRDNDDNLTQTQIFETIYKRVQVSGDEIAIAENKLKEQLSKLLKSQKIISETEGDTLYYSLKLTGKGNKK